jgi:hypothetical protein
MKRTRLVALSTLVRMATPRMARHTAAACIHDASVGVHSSQ